MFFFFYSNLEAKSCYKLIHSVNLFLFFSILFPNIWLGTFILIPFIITCSPDSTTNSKTLNPEFLTNNKFYFLLFFHQNGYQFRENLGFVVSELVVGSGEKVIYDMVWTRNKEKKKCYVHTWYRFRFETIFIIQFMKASLFT